MPQQRELLLFDPSSVDDQTESTTSSNHETHPLLEKKTLKTEKEEAKPPDGSPLETTTPPQTRHRRGASWINQLGSTKKTGKDVSAETKTETKVLDKEESHSNDDNDEAVLDDVASLEAKKPPVSRHRRGASLMNALGIIKSDAAGAAAPKTKADEDKSLSNDEAITHDNFLETKKLPPSRHRRGASWINPLGSMKNDDTAETKTEPKDDDKESLSSDQFDRTHPWPEADRNESPLGDDICGQQPFPTAPRLMDSFRLEQLHRESASNQDVHWLVGMLYAWLRYWYSGWTRLRQSLPTWSWPLIVLLTLFQPVVTLLVLPVAVFSFHYGQRLVLASASVVGLPTPTKAARLWLWVRNALRDRWHRWRVGMEQGRIVLVLVGMVLHFVRPAPNPPRRQHRR